jgi:hypothetical protein
VTAQQVAAYIAKYATKSTEAFTASGNRPRLDELPEHLARMAQAAQTLSSHRPLGRLRLGRHATLMGYGGHWSTKSRRYSTTLGAIRRSRAEYARRTDQGSAVPLDAWGRPLDDDQVLVVADWRYDGHGYHHPGDAILAAAAAARAREHCRTAANEEQHAVA